MDKAWFERGEILFGVGRHDEALASKPTVLARNPARTGQFVERAQLAWTRSGSTTSTPIRIRMETRRPFV